MNVKKKVVTFKRLLMGRTIQRNQHNFFQMFRSIWVPVLEFGRKSMAEVILLLCLWKIISRACWGGLHANDWLMARLMNTAMELWNCYGWKWPPRSWSPTLGSCLGTGLQHRFKSVLSQSWWLRWALRSHSIPSLGRIYSAALAWKPDINYWQKT